MRLLFTARMPCAGSTARCTPSSAGRPPSIEVVGWNRSAVMKRGGSAEEVTFNRLTAEARNDMQQAPGGARRVLNEGGMNHAIRRYECVRGVDHLQHGGEFVDRVDGARETALRR